MTNSDYDYLFSHDEYDKQNDYMNIRYAEKTNDADGLYFYSCTGEFTHDGNRYCATYEGIGLEPQSNFIGFLQQCINILY